MSVSNSETSRAAITFRSATTNDAPFLREMLYLALFVRPGSLSYPRSILDDPAIERYVRGWGTRPGDDGIIALADAVPVGAAWLRLFAADTPGYGFVDEATPELTIAVLPQYRNRGIGAGLVTRLQERVPAISLSCDPENPAWRLYLRTGFEPLTDRRTLLWTRRKR